MVLRMIIGPGLTVIALAVAGRRLWWLRRLATSGQPAPERIEYAPVLGRLRRRARRPGEEDHQGDRRAP